MLRKLLKHEFKAMGRILLPLYGAMIIMGLISSLLFKAEPTMIFQKFTTVRILSLISMILYVCLIFGSICLSYVIAIYRFKKNLFDAEGYLMNTLPVSAWQNTASKLIVSIIFIVLGLIAAAISGLAYVMVSIGFSELRNFGQITEYIRIITDNIGVMPMFAYTAETILLVLLTLVCGMLMIYACICVGHSSNSHKVLKSVGTYVLFYIISQFINGNIVNTIFKMLNSGRLIIANDIYVAQPYILLIIIIQLLYGAAYFAICNYFLNRKLNLQ